MARAQIGATFLVFLRHSAESTAGPSLRQVTSLLSGDTAAPRSNRNDAQILDERTGTNLGCQSCMINFTRRSQRVAVALTIALVAAPPLQAQTAVALSRNKFTPAEDVTLGRRAADDIEDRLPLLRDRSVNSYVASVGRRLVDAIPSNLRHREFRYSFKVVNVRDASAFALPGGPIYINRGMIEAARTEGELAGVLAHELSHVVLRHGTAQATKATPYQLGALAGAVAGALIGGRVGTVVSQGTQIGLGTAFLRYGRQFEREADLLGAQVMARAGYDPRQMASMFETLQRTNGSGGPEFLSSHPNPGNRQAAIAREAEMLQAGNRNNNSTGFRQTQARLDRMSPAPTTAQVVRNGD
jgi:predicted Zn-dependent protease